MAACPGTSFASLPCSAPPQPQPHAPRPTTQHQTHIPALPAPAHQLQVTDARLWQHLQELFCQLGDQFVSQHLANFFYGHALVGIAPSQPALEVSGALPPLPVAPVQLLCGTCEAAVLARGGLQLQGTDKRGIHCTPLPPLGRSLPPRLTLPPSPPRLPQILRASARERVEDFSCQELANLIWALANVGQLTAGDLEWLWPAAETRLERFRNQVGAAATGCSACAPLGVHVLRLWWCAVAAQPSTPIATHQTHSPAPSDCCSP